MQLAACIKRNSMYPDENLHQEEINLTKDANANCYDISEALSSQHDQVNASLKRVIQVT